MAGRPGGVVVDSFKLSERLRSWFLQLSLAMLLAAGLCASLSPSLARATDYEQANREFSEGKYEESRKTLEALGASRSPEAQYLLGLEYIQGLGGPTKVNEGIASIKDAANGGFPLAQFYLADAYLTQKRRYIGEADALRYLRSAAESGNEEAQLLWDRQYPPEAIEIGEAPETTPEEAPAPTGPESDDALLECIAAGNCDTPAEKSVAANAVVGTDDTSVPAPSATNASGDLQGALLVGGLAISALLFWLFFVGTRCPRCGKIRSSDVIGQEQTGQFVTTRMETVRDTTTHKDSNYNKTGVSERVSRVPVTITMREIDEHRRCRDCGHEFIKAVRREAR